MKTKSMFLIMIALVCGLIASIGISQVMEKGQNNGGTAPTSPMFVALAHIDIGDALDSSNVKLEQWPKDRVPEGAITSLEQLEARFARQRLYPGEPILAAKLMDSTAGDTSSKIPEGYRVCSIKVTMDTSVSNLIKPGDRVDLIAFFRKSSEVSFTGARTILRDVRVFAINTETERSVDKDGQVTSAKTVSLLAKPHQVEMVTLAGHLGKLQLALRRPNDQSDDDYGEITVQDLLNSDKEVADDRDGNSGSTTTAENSSKENFVEFLQTNEVASAQPPTPTVEPEPTVAEPAYTMVIFTPEGATHYRWQDETKLPEQAGSTQAAGAAAEAFAPQATANTPPAPSGQGSSNQVEFSDSSRNDSRNTIDSADDSEGSQFDGKSPVAPAP